MVISLRPAPRGTATNVTRDGTRKSHHSLPPGACPLATPADSSTQPTHHPSSRIAAAEFGVDRRVGGARECLADAVALFERHGWHWAFYSFRADGDWGGLDYELGTAPLGAAYWRAVEAGEDAEKLKKRGPNPLWDVLAEALSRGR